MDYDILQITKSKTRAAILELFFNDPQKEYYIRHIENITSYSAGNIHREMIRLQQSGLFVSRVLGRLRLYRLNTSHPIYNEIKSIVCKTIGIKGRLNIIINRHKEIKFAFIYGSFAKGKEANLSDIDIIIIGDTRPGPIKTDLYKYQSAIGREINSIVYATDEFLDKLRDRNHFITSLIKEPKIFLKGSEDEFRQFIQIRKNTKA